MTQSITNLTVAHPDTSVLFESQLAGLRGPELLDALDQHEHETFLHVSRVGEFAAALVLSGASGLPESQYENTVTAALAHDYGKLVVDADTLTKSGSLNQMEWKVIKRHPTRGFLMAIRSGMAFDTAAPILLHHAFQANDYPSLDEIDSITRSVNPHMSESVIDDESIMRRALVIAVADQFDARKPGNRTYSKVEYSDDDLASIILAANLEAGKLRTRFAKHNLVPTLNDLCDAGHILLAR